MEIIVGQTQRKKKKILFKGHWYLLDKAVKSGREYWKCTNKKCSGRLITSAAGEPCGSNAHDCMSSIIE
jgi:hypothetical protein